MADFGPDLLKSVTFELGPGHWAGWFRTFRGCVGQVSCDGCGVHGSFSYTCGPIVLCEAQKDPFRGPMRLISCFLVTRMVQATKSKSLGRTCHWFEFKGGESLSIGSPRTRWYAVVLKRAFLGFTSARTTHPLPLSARVTTLGVHPLAAVYVVIIH